MVAAVTAADLIAGARAMIERVPVLYLDAEGDLCRAGDGNNLVACPAVDDEAPWHLLNPDVWAAIPVMRDTIAALLDDRDVLTQRIEALEAALRFYIDPDNWLIGGPLDGDSPNYTGGPGRAALQADEGAQ